MTEYEFTFKDSYPILRFLLECKQDTSKLNKSCLEESTKKAIKEVLNACEEEKTNEISKEDIKDVDIEQETIKLYNSVKNIEFQYSDSAIDPKERIAMLKLQTTLLQQLLDMVKNSQEIKQIRVFEDAVFEMFKEEPSKLEKLQEIISEKE